MLKKSLFLSILFSLPGFCEEEATKTPPKPQIKRINDNEYQIGKIQVDKEKRQLSFRAGVNMTKGLIEYCLATTKSDKVHETLFLTDVSPLNINIASQNEAEYIVVYDSEGRMSTRENIVSSAVSIDVRDLSPGIYFAVIGVETLSFIVE